MKHMKLRSIPKKTKFKYLIIFVLIYLTFIYTVYYSFKNISSSSNEAFIKFLLNNNSMLVNDNNKFPIFVNKAFNYLLKIDFTRPSSLFNENIIGYEKQDNDHVDDLDSLKKVSFYITDPSKKEITNPVVYIYNSHQLENYSNLSLAKFGITPNVLMASYLLKEKLNDRGIPTIVEDTNMTEFLAINNWDYGSSYRASRIFILDKQNAYPTLKYFIDIHRDSVGADVTRATINDKNYAKILFVVGLEHDNYQSNLAIADKINNLFNLYYPGLSRGIYKKEGPNVNGIYNQDINPNTMLIEVGGVESDIIEVMNTMNAISDILYRYISENE